MPLHEVFTIWISYNQIIIKIIVNIIIIIIINIILALIT